MSNDRRIFDKQFCFESYGVTIRIESNRTDLLRVAEKTVRKALVGNLQPIENQESEHVLRVGHSRDGKYTFRDGDEPEFSLGKKLKDLVRYLNTIVRFKVAEFAVDHVFVHAGVVGWNGKAIVLPADSYHGKTTLTAELVKNGATYYSDDFAIFDTDGMVHPFARPLSVRYEHLKGIPTDVHVESIGGTAGTEPLPVGLVLLTQYRENARWKPKFLSPGEGMIELITQTIPIRYAPEFSIDVLKKVTARARIAKSYRNDAKEFAKKLLEFVDTN